LRDITVPGAAGRRECDAIPSQPARARSAYHAALDDDELLARLLITSWTLATGRTLPDGVPPALLSEDELIAFWADDQFPADGPVQPGPGLASPGWSSPVPAVPDGSVSGSASSV
jgi:hypothetical protein